MNKYAVLLFAVGFSLAFYVMFQFEHTFRPADGEIVSLQLLEQSKAGVSDSPYRYRVITPLLMAGVSDVWGYAMVEMTLITVLLVSVFVAGEQWRRDGTTAVLVVAILLTFSHEGMIYSTSRYVEAVLAAWALLYLRRDVKRLTVGYAALVAIASLNRSTGYLLVVLWFGYFALICGAWWDRAVWRSTLVYGALWAGIQGILMLSLGTAPQWVTVHELMTYWNVRDPARVVLYNLPLLALCIGALMSKQRAFMALVLLAYLPPVLLFGHWVEVGLWLPVVVVMVVAETYREHPDRDNQQADNGRHENGYRQRFEQRDYQRGDNERQYAGEYEADR